MLIIDRSPNEKTAWSLSYIMSISSRYVNKIDSVYVLAFLTWIASITSKLPFVTASVNIFLKIKSV